MAAGAAAVLLLVVVAAPLCVAQSRTTSGLGGWARDESEAPIPGVTIQIESPALIGGPRTTVSAKDGSFRFSELPPGAYVVTATLKGYRTVRIEGTQLSVGMTAEVPIEMELYREEEPVVVRAAPVAIDPTSSASSTILPPEFLANIPADRDPSHTLDFAPGVNIESAYGGGEEAGNSYQIDGVDISDPGAGGPWSLFNYSLFSEVQVLGLGAPAEYGQFSGAVFNSVTRSGGDDSSGSVELFYTDKSLTGSNTSDPELAASIEKHAEGSLEAGGPLRKDTLWYFVSAQYVRDLASEGGPTQTETDPRLFAKLTWQASPRDTLQGWIEWDHTKVIGRNGDAFTPLIATAGEDDPEVVWNLSWRSNLSARSILNLAWAGYTGHHNFDPHNGFSTPGHIDAQTDLASVNAQFFQKFDRTRNVLDASLARDVSGPMGEHDSKFGIEIERSSVRDRLGYPGGAFFSDNEGPTVDPSTGSLDFYTLGFFGGGFDVRALNQRASVYVQDSWRITPTLTLNPGLRLDVNRGRVSGSTVFRTNALAPRLGLAWDFEGDAETVLRAHYGRYYEALYTTFYQFSEPGAFFPLTTRRTFNTSGFTDTVAVLPSRSATADPGLRQPYLDQYVLGLDWEVFRGAVLSGTVVYRRSSDFIEIANEGRFRPVTGVVPGSGDRVTLFEDVDPTSDTLVYTNPHGLHRTYRGAILTLTRRMSRNWQLVASYVYSETRGNVDNLGFSTNPEDVSAPDVLGQLVFTPNSLVNAQGRLTHDQTQQIKLQGTRIFPSLHLSISADYVFHSGDTWTPQSDCLLTDDGNGVIGDGILGCHAFTQGPVTYLADTRGSRRLPSRSEIDLRAEWSHELAKGRRLRVDVDAFNLNNQGRATEVEPLVGPDLGKPATLNFPRNLRLGLAFEW